MPLKQGACKSSCQVAEVFLSALDKRPLNCVAKVSAIVQPTSGPWKAGMALVVVAPLASNSVLERYGQSKGSITEPWGQIKAPSAFSVTCGKLVYDTGFVAGTAGTPHFGFCRIIYSMSSTRSVVKNELLNSM